MSPNCRIVPNTAITDQQSLYARLTGVSDEMSLAPTHTTTTHTCVKNLGTS